MSGTVTSDHKQDNSEQKNEWMTNKLIYISLHVEKALPNLGVLGRSQRRGSMDLGVCVGGAPLQVL